MGKNFCKDSPHVFIPPVAIYAVVFSLSVFLQKTIYLPRRFFDLKIFPVAGWFFITSGFIFILPAVVTFIKSKNSFSTMQPSASLQASGIYSISRNPMYFGLFCIYTGMALLKASWWTIVLIPLLVILMNKYVIKREEKYLLRKFGKEFLDFKASVRRWI